MLSGFGNHHESEALSGALPISQNSPQVCPFDLYAEQINGTAFSQPRKTNQRSWLYRIKPSVGHQDFKAYTVNPKICAKDLVFLPNQLRWDPFKLPEKESQCDFVDGLALVASAGSPAMRNGLNILIYCFNTGMNHRAFYNSDVPQMGALIVKTEFGTLNVNVNEICVIPRGIVFKIDHLDPQNTSARGYILEIFSGHFDLPDLGPIGANGLANPQDFYYPRAEFDRENGSPATWNILNKFGNELFVAERSGGSPFNVVAWRVSWDHPDPSIFTVLTCKGSTPHSDPIADFVIFPPRWQVSEHTFRPPYFHRNAMTEFMGLILGDYEAKQDGGFRPGGASLHSLMTPHGPDSSTFKAATANPDLPQVPKKVAEGTMAFMFETSLMLGVTPWAHSQIQKDYCKVWSDLPGSSKI